jgi:hypothetical protein
MAKAANNVNSNYRNDLKRLLEKPSLINARLLEQTLREGGFRKVIFGGRINQKASIEAASEGDRGAVERLTNSFDASVTAARVAVGKHIADAATTPRIAIQQLLNANTLHSEWSPADPRISWPNPTIEFWDETDKRRFRRIPTGSGLCAMRVSDYGLGISRSNMAGSILALNSDSKLRTFEAVGQFGHGGSAALFAAAPCGLPCVRSCSLAWRGLRLQRGYR